MILSKEADRTRLHLPFWSIGLDDIVVDKFLCIGVNKSQNIIAFQCDLDLSTTITSRNLLRVLFGLFELT